MCFSQSLVLSFLFFAMYLQEVEEEVSRWEGYADWRNRAAVKGRHGGMLAASFVLGQFENSKFTPRFSYASFSLSTTHLY